MPPVTTRLYADGLNEGLGVVLAQNQKGPERLICCNSHSLTQSKWIYGATNKECLAIVWGIHSFQYYLVGVPFEVLTDHHSLQWLRMMKREDSLLSRWLNDLEEFQFPILHRTGKSQGHVNNLTCLPLPSSVATLADLSEVTRELEELTDTM